MVICFVAAILSAPSLPSTSARVMSVALLRAGIGFSVPWTWSVIRDRWFGGTGVKYGWAKRVTGSAVFLGRDVFVLAAVFFFACGIWGSLWRVWLNWEGIIPIEHSVVKYPPEGS